MLNIYYIFAFGYHKCLFVVDAWTSQVYLFKLVEGAVVNGRAFFITPACLLYNNKNRIRCKFRLGFHYFL